MKFFKRLNLGDECTWGYGFCYRDHWRQQVVTCPVPFNWLIGWSRKLLLVPMQGPAGKSSEYREGYSDGHRRGYYEGHQRGIAEGKADGYHEGHRDGRTELLKQAMRAMKENL